VDEADSQLLHDANLLVKKSDLYESLNPPFPGASYGLKRTNLC